MRSQKRFVVVSVLGIIAVVAGLSLLTWRMVTESGISGSVPWNRGERQAYEQSATGGSSESRTLGELTPQVDLNGIEGVFVRGGWDIRIYETDDPDLSVSVTERHADRVTVGRRGEVLTLMVAENTNYAGARFEAAVGLPSFSELEIVGLGNIEIRGLDIDELDVTVEGAANLIARDTTIETLLLSLDGAGNIDFSESPATNATVDIAGLANVAILMAGGVLDGRIEGLGRVTYSGNVSEQRIETDGGFLRAVNVEQTDQ